VLLLPPLPPLFFSFLFYSSFLSSLLCFFSFFSFGLPPLFYSLVLPLLLSLSFCSLFPCFYRQKTGERETEWPLCCYPFTAPPTRGKLWASGGVLGRRHFDAFQKKKVGENRGKKNLLLPLLRASRGRRRLTVPFKTAPFGQNTVAMRNVFFQEKNYKLNDQPAQYEKIKLTNMILEKKLRKWKKIIWGNTVEINIILKKKL